MIATDLFGNEGRLPRAALRAVDPPAQLDLIGHAAEAAAIASGRPLSQERAEIVAPSRRTTMPDNDTTQTGGRIPGTYLAGDVEIDAKTNRPCCPRCGYDTWRLEGDASDPVAQCTTCGERSGLIGRLLSSAARGDA